MLIIFLGCCTDFKIHSSICVSGIQKKKQQMTDCSLHICIYVWYCTYVHRIRYCVLGFFVFGSSLLIIVCHSCVWVSYVCACVWMYSCFTGLHQVRWKTVRVFFLPDLSSRNVAAVLMCVCVCVCKCVCLSWYIETGRYLSVVHECMRECEYSHACVWVLVKIHVPQKPNHCLPFHTNEHGKNWNEKRPFRVQHIVCVCICLCVMCTSKTTIQKGRKQALHTRMWVCQWEHTHIFYAWVVYAAAAIVHSPSNWIYVSISHSNKMENDTRVRRVNR